MILRTFEAAKEAYRDETELALDLETGGFSPWKDPIHVITLYGQKSDAITVLHYPRGQIVPEEVMRWLESFERLITHNGAQFDILFLANKGMDVERVDWYDTLIGEQVSIAVGRRDVRVNLQDTLKRRLGKTIDKTIDHAGWGALELSETHLAYCSGDIRHLVDLRDMQVAKCAEREGLLGCLDFEMALIPAIVAMELHGLPINLELLDKYMVIQEERIREAEKHLITTYGPLNFGSAAQVKKALSERFGEKLFPDTRKERLHELLRVGSPELVETLEALLLFRGAKQRMSMYSTEWRQKHVVTHRHRGTRVHGKFWQVGTDTGRMSSGEPNLQQVTRDMRDVFGHLENEAVGKSDFAQIEVRVSAALASDWTMINAINAGEDIHTFVASEAFGVPVSAVSSSQRKVAKAMNFLLLFGGGVEGLYAYALANGSDLGRQEINDAYERYFERFVGIADMKREATRLCDTRSAVPITYPTGLRRVIAGAELKPTTILNNIVQGTAAAGLKKGLAICYERGLGTSICAAIHDELVYTASFADIEEVRTLVDQCMIEGMQWALDGCPSISIGVESTWGPSWKGDPANERKTESRL